jgi:hypothetical protein
MEVIDISHHWVSSVCSVTSLVMITCRLLFYFVTFSPDIIKSHFVRYVSLSLPFVYSMMADILVHICSTYLVHITKNHGIPQQTIMPLLLFILQISLCRCIIRSKIAYHKRDISFSKFN